VSTHNSRIRERRTGADRRRSLYHLSNDGGVVRIPGWPEQRLQYITRFLFVLIAFIYFGLNPESAPYWVPLSYMGGLLGAYSVYNVYAWYKARYSRFSEPRCRFNMWLDLVMVTSCVVNDPYAIPVSLLAYAMVIMGNGMRYGIPLFRESLIGGFVCGALALAMRYGYGNNVEPVSGGMIFLCAFEALTVIYCYVLMGRISRSQYELEQLSRYDALTGLLNRRGLYESVDIVFQLLSRGDHRATLIFADMDHFKAINDSLGHTAGDRVLRAMGELMRRTVRSSDLVCRYGGDEFVLILPEATTAHAERITSALRTGVKQLSAQVGIEFGCSFGVREIEVAGTDFPTVLDEVDREMYRAKLRDEAPPSTCIRCDRRKDCECRIPPFADDFVPETG
jgi:diguanylate cyclase (GGDEF)-like protein